MVGTPAQQSLVKKYFDPFFNWNDDNKLRDWLRQQKPDELEQFLDWFNFSSRRDRETLGRQELAKLRKKNKLRPEMVILKPSVYGMGLDLKEVCRRLRSLWGGGKQTWCAALTLSTLVFFGAPSNAEWKVETGKKAFSSFEPTVAPVATVPAKAPFKGVNARLQIECFTHPQLRGVSFGIVLSKAPPNGFMAWRFQYDGAPAIKNGPFSRTLPATSISLGNANSQEFKQLRGAKRLMLTLLPADGSELPYEFDVSGAEKAIKSISCQ